MTKEVKKKMDELAEDAAQFCTCTGIVCHGCEKSTKSNFIKGFEAGYMMALHEIQQLRTEDPEQMRTLTMQLNHLKAGLDLISRIDPLVSGQMARTYLDTLDEVEAFNKKVEEARAALDK